MYKFACSECTVHVQDDYLSILIAAAWLLDLSEEVCSLGLGYSIVGHIFHGCDCEFAN